MTAAVDVAPVAPVAPDPAAATPAVPATERRGHGPGLAVALTASSLIAVLVAALLIGGGAPEPATAGLPDAGPAVGWGQPFVTLLSRLLAVLVVGSLLVAAVLRPAPGGVLPAGSRAAVRVAAGAGLAWAAAEGAALVLLTGALIGRPVTRLAPGDVWAAATGLRAGRVALAVVGLLLVGALLAVLLLAVTTRREPAAGVAQARVLLAVALAAVVLPVVTTGHSAAAGAHLVTVSVLAVHVVAASLWTGGLLGSLLHLRGAGADRTVAVLRLSRLALGCVVVVGATGVVGALLVTDVPVPVLLSSGYGTLLLAKTVAVLLLVWAGWEHRRRTLPLLGTGAGGAFVRLAVVEAGVMAAVLAVAVGLSSAPPPTDPVSSGSTVAADLSPEPPPGALRRADPQPVDPVPAGTGAEPVAEDMTGHDHGELSVAVLVDDERLHVGGPVLPGTPVTVYNTGTAEVVLRAEDGSFDTVVPSRTFVTFLAPLEPGGYAFGDPTDRRYADVLLVGSP